MAASVSVFPTRVGVDRRGCGSRRWQLRFPHTRGGGPVSANSLKCQGQHTSDQNGQDKSVQYKRSACGLGLLLELGQVFATRLAVDRL